MKRKCLVITRARLLEKNESGESMYVVHIIDSLHIGGAQQLLVTFARQALGSGHKVAVVSLDEGNAPGYTEQFKALGVAVVSFPTKRIFDLSNYRRILQWLRSENPDILHAHLTYATIMASLIAPLIRRPVVVTLHSTRVDPKFHAPRTEWLEGFLLRHVVRKVIACGPSVQAHFQKKIGKKQILTIANAVDKNPYVNATRQEIQELRLEITGGLPAKFIVLSVGRLMIQKGFFDLLDAFARVCASHPQAFLAIAGDGEIYNSLRQRINHLDLGGNVRLLGPRTDVPRLLPAADAFALASHWEGLPVSILEAMAAGLPVLATDVGDIRWALGSAGLFVEPENIEQISSALAALVQDDQKRRELGGLAQKRIKELFSPSDWFDKLMSVYREALAKDAGIGV